MKYYRFGISGGSAQSGLSGVIREDEVKKFIKMCGEKPRIWIGARYECTKQGKIDNKLNF